MSATKYTYSISADFPNGAVIAHLLMEEVRASSITIALDNVSTLGDVCDVWFKDEITAGEKAVLDALVSAHTGVQSIFQLAQPVAFIAPQAVNPNIFPVGVTANFTGAGDEASSGAGRGAGTEFKQFGITTVDDYEIEFSFMDWVYIAGGSIMFDNAEAGDYCDFQAYAPATPVTPVTPGTGNCVLVHVPYPAGNVIVPHPGGTHQVDLSLANPVPSNNSPEDEPGTGFWEWDLPALGKGAVSAGVPQKSHFHLLDVDTPLDRYVRKTWMHGSRIKVLQIPNIKPRRVLPHWKLKTTIHVAGARTNMNVSWELQVARVQTLP